MHNMESYNMSLLARKIFEFDSPLVHSRTLMELLEIRNRRSFFSILKRLQDDGILQRLEKDKYRILQKNVSSFQLANFLYEPSYISLETALSYWGILPQFPFEITSVTLKKTVTKSVDDIVYSYSHLSNTMYGLYTKEEEFLIATPEKSLFDQLYLVARGWRTLELDECDLSNVNKKEFLRICTMLQDDRVNRWMEGLQW
jgi:predicted transcriptional regulator of viral defense system